MQGAFPLSPDSAGSGAANVLFGSRSRRHVGSVSPYVRKMLRPDHIVCVEGPIAVQEAAGVGSGVRAENFARVGKDG